MFLQVVKVPGGYLWVPGGYLLFLEVKEHKVCTEQLGQLKRQKDKKTKKKFDIVMSEQFCTRQCFFYTSSDNVGGVDERGVGCIGT